MNNGTPKPEYIKALEREIKSLTQAEAFNVLERVGILQAESADGLPQLPVP